MHNPVPAPLFILADCALLFVAAVAAVAQPVFHQIEANSSRIERYDKFELTLDLGARFDNPFDFGQMALQAVFTAPSGAVSTVDGFYYQPYRRSGRRTVAEGAPVWKIRFAPTEPGLWSYHLEATDFDGSSSTQAAGFTCVETGRRGFLRPEGRYLRFDDGSPFFALGENMGWGDFSNPIGDYQDWLDDLAAHGGNYIRTWMASWGFALEWSDTGLGDYRRRQHRAWQLDWLIEHAGAQGIYIQLVLHNHGQVSSRVNPQWADNPYNTANGGPAARPGDFFTDTRARQLVERRLRYIVARWGYATSVMAWELFNEVDWTDNYDDRQGDIAQWHADMGRFLKRVDPNGHLVTTSLGRSQPNAAVWDKAAIDITQVHYYDLDADPQQRQWELTGDFRAAQVKPVMLGEFCFQDPEQARLQDPTGIYLHNTLWASAFSGALGAAAIWWWDNYIEPQDLYYHFTGLARFMDQVDLAGSQFVPRQLHTNSEQLRGFALQGEDQTLGWLQQRAYNWRAVGEEGPPASLAEGVVQLAGMARDGLYDIEWWDTASGTVVARQEGEAIDGILGLEAPSLEWDLAFKATHRTASTLVALAAVPEFFALQQNYPNPFNASTFIPYKLAGQSPVQLTVLDLLGRQVRILVERDQSPGLHRALWDGRDDDGRAVGAGLYFYRLQAEEQMQTRRMILLK
ncbi:MAG: DUF5060 domain-containing protein [Candidatus Latescibacteria bacterium]|nr:DUF5060 domain-containing protein [Candidatus Latescibacterota bacterium]